MSPIQRAADAFIEWAFGVEPAQYPYMLAVTRIVDKLFRIASDPDALGEEPFMDIVGYGLLGLAMTRGLRKEEKGA